jgi:hypothetical protein
MEAEALSTLRINQVLRLSRPKSAQPPHLGDYANFYAATQKEDAPLVLLEAGINPIRAVQVGGGGRVPAILIASSPHKIGTKGTPWQDHFETDNGHIRYYGDNRRPGADPRLKRGNAALLRAYESHAHHDVTERRRAVPLLFFKRVPREGRRKGFAEFHGFGIVTAIELVTQFSEKAGGSFSNYAFDFLVMSMKDEHECFDWEWINSRREASASDADCLAGAPQAWKDWVSLGDAAIPRVRRRVSKLLVESSQQQLPATGSAAAKALKDVYAYYDGNNAHFEALASIIAERVISPSGKGYRFGGLTRASGDGGIDFIARLEVGSGYDGGYLGPARLVVLGQAKCQRPDRPTQGRDIARTVARLRRGWLGVYVTTSFFSAPTQREVIEDRYPIVLINGKRVGEEVHKMTIETGGVSVKQLLDDFEDIRLNLTEIQDPEDVLTQ